MTNTLNLTTGEVITLKRIFEKYVRLIASDTTFEKQFTTPEIFEIREVHKKLLSVQPTETKGK